MISHQRLPLPGFGSTSKTSMPWGFPTIRITSKDAASLFLFLRSRLLGNLEIYMSCKGVAGNTITQLIIVGSQFAMLGSFAHVGQPDHHLQHPKKRGTELKKQLSAGCKIYSSNLVQQLTQTHCKQIKTFGPQTHLKAQFSMSLSLSHKKKWPGFSGFLRGLALATLALDRFHFEVIAHLRGTQLQRRAKLCIPHTS